jgi:NADH:ubiquinone oxidoreductase subunit 3 (subunit A)
MSLIIVTVLLVLFTLGFLFQWRRRFLEWLFR